MFKKTIIIGVLLALISCKQKETALTVQEIVDKAIATAGGNIVESSSIHFKFRDYYYRAKRENSSRILERCTDPECIAQRDILKDGDFSRFRESERVDVPDSMKTRYGNSVNSVHYFSVLPYGLNDAAVHKKLVTETTVKGAPYYRIKVTFAQDGGGTDFEDEYMYWIHKETFHVDYLAYNYQVNEGGTRFREAYNARTIEGIRFVDYRNYKTKDQYPPLTSLDSLFENGALDLLSKIELEAISVSSCPEC